MGNMSNCKLFLAIVCNSYDWSKSFNTKKTSFHRDDEPYKRKLSARIVLFRIIINCTYSYIPSVYRDYNSRLVLDRKGYGIAYREVYQNTKNSKSNFDHCYYNTQPTCYCQFHFSLNSSPMEKLFRKRY